MSEENNHIEQFFKKHLEVEQASFMEEDWAKMEAKLDAAGLGASGTSNGGIGIRKGMVILILATTIAFILGWFLKDYGQKPDNLTVNGTTETIQGEKLASEKSQDDMVSTIGETSPISTSQAEENRTQNLSIEEEISSGASSVNVQTETDENTIKSESDIQEVTVSLYLPVLSNSEERVETTSSSQLTNSLKRSDSTTDQVNGEPLATSESNKNELNQTVKTTLKEEGLIASNSGNDEFNEVKDLEDASETRSSIPTDEKLIDQTEQELKDDLSSEDKMYLQTHLVTKISGDSLILVQQEVAKIPDSLLYQSLTGKLICLTAPKMFQWQNFAVGLSYAPDFNSLNFKGKLKATNKLGLRLFWKPLKRFELQSGIFFNEKKYTSPGEEYHPPAGYWGSNTNGIVPEWVNGSCSVIDIPITLGIDVIQTNRWNWSVNGGLSNYILLDEKYQYEFDQPNPNTAWGWETDENTTLKWSVMNASIGGEFLWRSKTSLKIEPFIQVPLQEIGWAKVSLYGYGVLFTFKQNLFLNNR